MPGNTLFYLFEFLMYTTKIVLITCILLLMQSCSGSHDSEPRGEGFNEATLTIFTASSMFQVVNILSEQFMSEHEVKVRVNSASSGTLARQIQQGAAADIFISASPEWIEYLDSLGLILGNEMIRVAENQLVLVTPSRGERLVGIIDSTLALPLLLGDYLLAIGDPRYVPVGQYARQALEYFSWYASLQNRMVTSKDASATLRLVELAEARFGIVYLTDARSSEKVSVVGTFPDLSHKSIACVAAPRSGSSVVKTFLEFLKSEQADSVLTVHHFETIKQLP
jgi:molybdate transport system substrate-binding protein